ncbi:DUF421 domain-containing protein [Flaviflexus huanghaiensis]|uniref:DUF421 domain-containing protein n=1 Tax=Flaviflexus huanghaiensis TaxID=1111473 RepID=UPI0015FAA466|nr:YetF domain-containing protein [Flaviflexus huanghaiensis]
MFFDSWQDLIRVLIMGVLTYVVVVVILRISGKRTLSQLNAFDFIVNVALGSVMATIMLSSDVSLSEGIVTLSVLAGLQVIVAVINSRVPAARGLITSSPALLIRDGQVLSEALKVNRLSESALRQAIRMTGIGGLDQVGAVILETNGTMSVIPQDSMGDRWTVSDVDGLSKGQRSDGR